MPLVSVNSHNRFSTICGGMRPKLAAITTVRELPDVEVLDAAPIFRVLRVGVFTAGRLEESRKFTLFFHPLTNGWVCTPTHSAIARALRQLSHSSHASPVAL